MIPKYRSYRYGSFWRIDSSINRIDSIFVVAFEIIENKSLENRDLNSKETVILI